MPKAPKGPRRYAVEYYVDARRATPDCQGFCGTHRQTGLAMVTYVRTEHGVRVS